MTALAALADRKMTPDDVELTHVKNHASPSTFATLFPKSAKASEVVRQRHNLQHVALCEDCPAFPKPPSAISINHHAMLGSSCFSFGSSRTNDIVIPASDGVCPQEFLLLFDLEPSLNIKNTSLRPMKVQCLIAGREYQIAQGECVFPETKPYQHWKAPVGGVPRP